jgi:hypothetical protein
MKTLNKQLLSVAGLAIALFALTSFNPLSYHYTYNSEVGSQSLSSQGDDFNSNRSLAERAASDDDRDDNGAKKSAGNNRSRNGSAPSAQVQASFAKDKELTPQEKAEYVRQHKDEKGLQRPTARGTKPGPQARRSDSDRTGVYDLYDVYEKTPGGIRKKDSTDTKHAITFHTDQGLAVVQEISTKKDDGYFSEGKVLVYYTVIPDKKHSTEGGVNVDCADCRKLQNLWEADLAKTRSVEIDALDIDKLRDDYKAEKYNDYTLAIGEKIVENVAGRKSAFKEKKEAQESTSCMIGDDFNATFRCFKNRLREISKNKYLKEDTDDVMEDIENFVQEVALDHDSRTEGKLERLQALATGKNASKIRTMIREAIDYNKLLDERDDYHAHIEETQIKLQDLDQQAQMMGCTNMTMGQNMYCGLLNWQREDLLKSAQADMMGLKRRFMNSSLRNVNKKDALGTELKANLVDAYGEFADDFEMFTGNDPSLRSLNASTLNSNDRPTLNNPNSLTGLNNGMNMNRQQQNRGPMNNQQMYNGQSPLLLQQFRANGMAYQPGQYRQVNGVQRY